MSGERRAGTTKARVWLGEDVWPGHCWHWCGDRWYPRGDDWLVSWGDVHPEGGQAHEACQAAWTGAGLLRSEGLGDMSHTADAEWVDRVAAEMAQALGLHDHEAQADDIALVRSYLEAAVERGRRTDLP